MLADDQLLVRGDLDKALRGDGIEAATAGVPVVNRDDSEVVVHAGADAVVGAHCPGVDLGGALIPLRLKCLLLL